MTSRRTHIILLLAAVGCAAYLFAQQPQPRIAGLENNKEYIALLEQDAALQAREDSIVNAADAIRRRLRTDSVNRQQLSRQILQLENSIFEIRNAKGRLIDRINTIEQEWVLAGLNGGRPAADGKADSTAGSAADSQGSAGSQGGTTTDAAVSGGGSAPGGAGPIPDSLKVRNLVDNVYFEQHLPADDYKALRRAQEFEMSAVDYVNVYFSNYELASEMAGAYAGAATEPEANDIYEKYTALQTVNGAIADSLSTVWNYIFDNKSYAYGYILDNMDREDVLVREEAALAGAARNLSAMRAEVASEAVADYFLRKKVAVDYEIAVAEALSLTEARDSLRGVARQIDGIDFRLPRLDVERRYFIAYDSLSFPKTSPYAKDPIPECRVYERGTIYRILLGTFSAKRPASIFKGVYPLGYLVDEKGQWSYYAGGFATRAGADEAQKTLKSRGFARPEVVMWKDSVARNLTRDPIVQTTTYLVEISGAESLSDAAKAALAQAAPGSDVSRTGAQAFVVGPLGDRAAADRVAAALTGADAAIEIKVVEKVE